MHGGSKAPSLLPRYATDYVIHTEVVRKLYTDGFGKFLFDMKKGVYPLLPFCIGGYKFTKVKSALDFVKLIENFHFGEKNFHINSAWDKVSKYCASVGVHFEYFDHFDKDEKVYWNACNMTFMNKSFNKKITITRGKGGSSSTY